MRSRSGFTLIELLVVIAIIGILAAIALPKLFAAICRAKMGQGNGVIGSINSALSQYYADLEGRLPSTSSASLQGMAYFHPKYMVVPADPWGGDYRYAGNGESYTLQFSAGANGCDNSTATGDEFTYYSSTTGLIKSSSASVL